METVALEGDGKQMRWNGNGEKRAKIVWKPFPTSLSTASQFPALGEIFSLCLYSAVFEMPSVLLCTVSVKRLGPR